MSRIPTVSNAVWLSALVACGEMATLPISAGAGPLVMKRAGAGSPSANRITLLRDTDGDGISDVRSVLLQDLNSPFGMALVALPAGPINPNGLAWEPQRGALWTVVNERDEIGSDLVPDFMTSVRDGAFYGWPYSYYGQPAGASVDVLTGFLSDEGTAFGRPVGVALDKKGALLVADDVGNVVWRVTAHAGSLQDKVTP